PVDAHGLLGDDLISLSGGAADLEAGQLGAGFGRQVLVEVPRGIGLENLFGMVGNYLLSFNGHCGSFDNRRRRMVGVGTCREPFYPPAHGPSGRLALSW